MENEKDFERIEGRWLCIYTYKLQEDGRDSWKKAYCDPTTREQDNAEMVYEDPRLTPNT